MEESLSGTLAIDLGNTNTVIAFQNQKDINSVLVEYQTLHHLQELFLQPFGSRNLRRFLKLVLVL